MPNFFTMCATVFSPEGGLDDAAFRSYLQRQIDAGLGVYLGSGGNGETHGMSPDELHTMYRIGVEMFRGKFRCMPICRRKQRRTRRSLRRGSRGCGGGGVASLYGRGPPCYKPTDRELTGYFGDVLSVIDHPVVIAVNPTMGYIPKPAVIASIIRSHKQIIGARLSGQPQII